MNTPHPTNPMNDPHAGQPLLVAGPAPEDAAAVLILLHGRGASAQDILAIHRVLDLPDIAALAPQAAGHTWYPRTFLAPLDSNQPWLDSALARIDALVSDLSARGIPSRRIALLGFSQGACLATEYVARRPRRYGAVMGLTGGLIGPPGTTWDGPGDLDAAPIFLGASDPDPHVPVERVRQTQAVLERMGGRVELRLYPGMPHTINDDELRACRDLLSRLSAPARGM